MSVGTLVLVHTHTPSLLLWLLLLTLPLLHTEQQSLSAGRKCGLSAEKYEDVLIHHLRSLCFCFPVSLGIFFFSSFVSAHWAFIPPLYNAWAFFQQNWSVYTNMRRLTQVFLIMKAYWFELNGIVATCSFRSAAEFWCFTISVMCPYSVCGCVWMCVCVFQHALRLLAFGQLYKVLNMDPLPASKPSPRLLEGVCSIVRVFSYESV